MAKPTRRRARAEDGAKYLARRDQILDIALAAFRSKGYAGTSMRDIGRALQRTKGSLYYYFPDKEEILYRCHVRALDHIHAVAERVRRRAHEPAEQLRELIEEHVRIMVHEFHGTALALEVGALTGERQEEVVRRRDRYERMMREVLARGVRQGVFRRVDVKLAAFAILGSVNWIAQWYRAGGTASAEDIGSLFADLFLRALAAEPAGRARGAPARSSRGGAARAPQG